MTLMSSEIYDALREVGVSHDRALKAAEALAPSPAPGATRLLRIERLLIAVLVINLFTMWGMLLYLTR
jgi:hypothetical protein